MIINVTRIKLLQNDGLIHHPRLHELPKGVFGRFGDNLHTISLRRSESQLSTVLSAAFPWLRTAIEISRKVRLMYRGSFHVGSTVNHWVSIVQSVRNCQQGIVV
jgi:hypothetical protein